MNDPTLAFLVSLLLSVGVPLIPQRQARWITAIILTIIVGYSGYSVGYRQASKGEKSFFNLIQPNSPQTPQEKRNDGALSFSPPPVSAPSPSPSQTASPSVSPTPPPPTIPTASPESKNRFQVKYENREYPQSQCGRIIGAPVYPVFIAGSWSNYQRVRREFCRDAYYDYVGGRIQVASFSDEPEANDFVVFMKQHFNEAWKGEPQ
ncbi:hypothetical protein NDI45_13775 [Leptolyngbya sp. GB1-A1]|uniref:hypothetical protein n=1 Tax=Leptolyngbya sp. GB1-A1 TaxID=2933908 RepID=UPI003298CA66